MKLSLLRDEIRRYPTQPIAPSPPIRVTQSYPLAKPCLSTYCEVGREVSHYRCTATWCECPCHDNNNNMWMGI